MKKNNLKLARRRVRKYSACQIISLADFEQGLGLRLYDKKTRQVLLWLVKLGKKSKVDVNCLFELQTFCKYLLISLSRVEGLFNYMHENDISLKELEINNLGVTVEETTEEIH